MFRNLVVIGLFSLYLHKTRASFQQHPNQKMASFESFLPNSSFGVPLHPFPPGTGWATTREMLEEILADLQIPWVQDFILRSHPKQDVNAFSDRNNQSRALSRVLRATPIRGISGGFTSAISRVRLQIPVVSIDNIGVGIAVTEHQDEGATHAGYLKRFEFSRFVSNKRTNSELIVGIHEDLNQVDCTYYKNKKDDLWIFVILNFDYKTFLSSLDVRTSGINFDLANRSLNRSIVGGVQHHQKRHTRINRLYPNYFADNSGDHFLRQVISAHANGQHMMAIPVFAHGSWHENTSDLTGMRHWAISNRLQRIQVSPIHNILSSTNIFQVNEQSEEAMGGDNFLPPHQVCTQAPNTAIMGTSPLNIAPRPLPISQTHSLPPTISQLQEDGRNERIERRKIKKREAAARAYRRKVAKNE